MVGENPHRKVLAYVQSQVGQRSYITGTRVEKREGVPCVVITITDIRDRHNRTITQLDDNIRNRFPPYILDVEVAG